MLVLFESSDRASARGVYCTIVAQNYLPQALALYESIKRVEPERKFVILVVDGERSDLESGRPGLRVVSTEILGLPDREVDNMATIYDVVELSTAVKPAFLKVLLGEFEQAVYLDPDMYLVSPLAELEYLIDQHGVVLTPHFLEAIPPGSLHISEVHSLTTGVHNLGFCAVGRNGSNFLDWWWDHLRRECLIYPLLGLFVDQKWTDIGATLFSAASLKHYGYNVGPWNLHERSFDRVGPDWKMTATGESLRLLHFSGFNPNDPDAVSVRLNVNLRDVGIRHAGLSELSRDYAEELLRERAKMGTIPGYGYGVDSDGKPLTQRLRRAYRKALLASEGRLPSPFRKSEAQDFRGWKRKSWRSQMAIAVGDSALAVKYAFPERYAQFKSLAPAQFGWVRRRLLKAGEVRR